MQTIRASVVCYALSNQVSKFVVNIDLGAEMEPCNRSSGRSETKYESCEKQCCKILKKKKTHLTSYSLSGSFDIGFADQERAEYFVRHRELSGNDRSVRGVRTLANFVC